jgi:hypothetical protein
MIKSFFWIILVLFFYASCNGGEGRRKQPIKEIPRSNMTDVNFKNTIEKIKNSDIYENPKNWEARGLNSSSKSVILILRRATNNFLKNLEEIYKSNETSEMKLREISDLVDELPWDELDTEEREFLADTLAPAIKAAGFDPWSIF